MTTSIKQFKLLPLKQALILIDIQVGLDLMGFYGSERNNPNAENNASRLLCFFRKKNWPVYHVKHDSTNPDSPLYPSKEGNKIKAEVAPLKDEPLYLKNVNSAFIGTSLENDLKAAGIKKIIIAGLTIEHCISTSTRMAANLGFETTLVADATAAFDKVGLEGQQYSAQQVFEISIATLSGEFASVVHTDQLITALS